MADRTLALNDLRGGINDGDSPISLQRTEVVSAVNMDYRAGQIGTKRGGCTALSMTGSVFTRDVPVMSVRDMSGWASANSGNIVTSAGSSNSIFVISISCPGRTVSTVKVDGVDATLKVAQTQAGQRVEMWYFKNPASGATVAITLSGVGACDFVVERWTNVDVANSPVATSSSNNANSNLPNAGVTGSAYDATMMAISALVWPSGGHTTDSRGVIYTVDRTTNAPINVCSKLGMKPTTQFKHDLASALDWAEAVIALKGANLGGGHTQLKAIVRHESGVDPSFDELWAQDTYGRLDRALGPTAVWQGGVPMGAYGMGSFLSGSEDTNGASLNGKLFLALGGTIYADRTHVWDGSVLRWAGLSAPTAAPTAADSGGAGSLTGVRYYRVRWVEIVGGVVKRRSEPGPVLTFTPSGANASVTVTRPALGGFISGEGETHWEIEASVDNNTFYRLSQVINATTTYVDTISASTGYAAFTLSEALTEYTPLYAGKHVTVDEARVLVARNSVSGTVFTGQVCWTPLTADLGVGNDERVPATSRFFLNMDPLNGGQITHLMPAVMGGVMVFKTSRIYKLIRTGRPSKAYDSVQLTPNRGAAMRSCSSGTDEQGFPCVYFVDPSVGGCRWGKNGCEDLMQKRRTLAARINPSATVVARSIFHPKHWLVWNFLALDNGTSPNYIACYNVRQGTWTDYTGNMATGFNALLYPTSQYRMRVLMLPGTYTTGGLQEADSGTSDDGTYFSASIVTKAFALGALFTEFEVDRAVLHARAGAASVQVSVIRNLGEEQINAAAVSIAAAGSETYVTPIVDDVHGAELDVVQFRIGDPVGFAGAQLAQGWTLEALVVAPTGG